MCTHLHVDHVGWNTRLEGQRWVPTFPNARYVIHGEEWQFWKWESEQGREPSGCVADSVLPVVEAGRAALVDRSEERRVGKACPSLCRSRWSPYH